MRDVASVTLSKKSAPKPGRCSSCQRTAAANSSHSAAVRSCRGHSTPSGRCRAWTRTSTKAAISQPVLLTTMNHAPTFSHLGEIAAPGSIRRRPATGDMPRSAHPRPSWRASAVWRCGAGSPACSITRYGSCGSRRARRSGGFRRYGCARRHGWVRDKLQAEALTHDGGGAVGDRDPPDAERHGKGGSDWRGGSAAGGERAAARPAGASSEAGRTCQREYPGARRGGSRSGGCCERTVTSAAAGEPVAAAGAAAACAQPGARAAAAAAAPPAVAGDGSIYYISSQCRGDVSRSTSRARCRQRRPAPCRLGPTIPVPCRSSRHRRRCATRNVSGR